MTELPDEALEAFFLGEDHEAWQQDEALVGLAEQVAMAAGGAVPRPSPALRAFLGESAGASAPPLAATRHLPAGPPSHSRTVPVPATTTGRGGNVVPLLRRLRSTVGIAAAAGVAAAALTVAGTTGALPDPAMRAVSWVVEAVTPFELPDRAPTVTGPERAPGPRPTSTVPADPEGGQRPPAPGAVPGQPAATRPATPGPSVPTGVPGSVQPPGPGVDPGRPTPTGPLGPVPPAGVSPPAGGGGGPLATTPVDRGTPVPTSTRLSPAGR